MNFRLQRFGDNDVVTFTREGKLVMKFYDGDTRTLTIDNPRTDVTVAQINALVTSIVTNRPILGDQTAANPVGAESFKVFEKTDRKLDLS